MSESLSEWCSANKKWVIGGLVVGAVAVGFLVSRSGSQTKAEKVEVKTETKVEAQAEVTVERQTETKEAVQTQEAEVKVEGQAKVTAEMSQEVKVEVESQTVNEVQAQEAEAKVESQAKVTAEVIQETEVEKLETFADELIIEEEMLLTDKVQEGLSYENLLAMFKDMIQEMPGIMFRISQQCQEMQRNGFQETEISGFAEAQYNQEMTDAHHRLLEKYKCTEDEENAAVQKYQNDEKFQKLMGKLEHLNRTLMGEPDPEQMDALPTSLDADRVIEIFARMMNTVTECLAAAMKTVHEEHKHLNSTQQDAMTQQIFAGLIGDKKQAVFDHYGIEEHMLDLALQKHSQNPTVVTTIMNLQRQQQLTLAQLKRKWT